MKPRIACIFAHPDDEAFGPGGTIAEFSKTHDVYILCATKGEAGQHHNEQNIAKIRQQELQASASILGVKKVDFLGFVDGCLCNKDYHLVANKVNEYLEKIKPDTLLTFEPQGVSGHLDHIAISMITTYVFEHTPFVKKLFYYCHTEEQVRIIKRAIGDYFVYFPRGYRKSDIGKTVDVSSVWKTKVQAMKKHQSQIDDVNMVLSFLEKMPKEEHFIVRQK